MALIRQFEVLLFTEQLCYRLASKTSGEYGVV
jgi:hypothetical protein